MSCVVGAICNNSVLLASDSIVTLGESLVYTNHKKLVATKNLSAGVVGTVDLVPIIHEVMSLPEFASVDYVDDDLIHTIPDKFKELTSERKFIRVNGGEDEFEIPYFDGEILLSNGTHLYRLHSTFSMIDAVDGFCAIGQGSDIASGVLYCLKRKNQLDEDSFLMALDAAVRYSIWVRPPYVVYTHRVGEPITKSVYNESWSKM